VVVNVLPDVRFMEGQLVAIGSKPLDQVTAADIALLCQEQPEEGTQLEFKEQLSTNGKSEDQWMQGSPQIGEKARNELLEVVVAFANAHGGHLLLGIEESGDKPSRAVAIRPIPRCAELAEKIRLQARDCIEPQLPVLSTCGVVTDGNGGGVIVIRVETSRLAPHRLKQTRHCYHRRADRSEKMTMREIQDLTLSRDRGFAKVDEHFSVRRSSFDELMKEKLLGFGFRVTLFPIGHDFYLPTLQKHPFAFPHLRNYSAQFGDVGGSHVDLHATNGGGSERPILRGVRRSYGSESAQTIQEATCDGGIEIIMTADRATLAERPRIQIGWLLARVANGLSCADAMRRAGDAPELEYGLEIEVFPAFANLNLVWFFDHFGEGNMGILDSVAMLPRLSVGAPSVFNTVITIVTNDLRSIVGVGETGAKLQVGF
jgi:hypothetical protein